MADEAECPICGTVVDQFDPCGHQADDARPRCPGCKSVERHRAVWLTFKERTNLFTEQVRMLHVAPEKCLGPRLEALPNVDYLSARPVEPRAMVKMDLTAHRPARRLLRRDLRQPRPRAHPRRPAGDAELRRVLRPGGWAMLLVPMFGPVTKEDPSIVDPDERSRRFGQHDHVRLYGHDGVYEDRLSDGRLRGGAGVARSQRWTRPSFAGIESAPTSRCTSAGDAQGRRTGDGCGGARSTEARDVRRVSELVERPKRHRRRRTKRRSAFR